jgi:large conductance mechanosensitive channel
MRMIQEFKAFAMRGNVLDMAIGIIIGGAFGKIVSSLVSDVIMPPIGKLTGGVDFKSLFLVLGPEKFASLDEASKAGAATINYGVFITSVIDFIIVAFVIFLLVKGMNTLKKKEEAKPAPIPMPSAEVQLLTEIRDSLKHR